MKIVVVMESGEQRLIELESPMRVIEGERLNRLVDGQGIDHWFTKSGRYDGWGCNVGCEQPSEPSEGITQ